MQELRFAKNLLDAAPSAAHGEGARCIHALNVRLGEPERDALAVVREPRRTLMSLLHSVEHPEG